MRKSRIGGIRAMGMGLAFAGLVLVVQLTMGADPPCQVPNINTISCVNLIGVTACNTITTNDASACDNARVHNIKQFPQGAQPSATGATKQESADCYQTTLCSWSTIRQRCEPGATLPSGTTWYQAQKTVINRDVTCPTPKG